MVAKGVIVALALLAAAERSLALLPCQEPCYNHHDNGTVTKNCGPTPTCSYGFTTNLGDCNCCDICAQGPGEKCGGDFYLYKCGKGFECEVLVPRPINRGYPPTIGDGICVAKKVTTPKAFPTTKELETTTIIPTTEELETTTIMPTTKEFVTTFPWKNL